MLITSLMRWFVITLWVASASVVSANIVRSFEFGGSTIRLDPETSLNLETWGGPKKIQLSLAGSGRRVKHILFISADVYVAGSYVEKGEDVGTSPTKMMRLQFVRDLSESQISSAFQDALKENGLEVDVPPLSTVLRQMKFTLRKGDTVDVVAFANGRGSDTLLIRSPDRAISAEGVELGNAFWKVWYGKPADGGMEDLKKELMGY